MSGKQPLSKTRSTPIRQTRKRGPTQKVEQNVPDVYQDMLAEAFSSSPTRFGDEPRPLKRRRVGPIDKSNALESKDETTSATLRSITENNMEPDSDPHEDKTPVHQQQTAYNDSSDSEESEVDWEEVDIGGQGGDASVSAASNTDKSLEIVLQGNEFSGKKGVGRKRKPLTAKEKSARLVIHKAHLLCLIAHVDARNQMCNDDEAQTILKILVSKKTISHLNPANEFSQFQKTRSFTDGLTQVNKLWRSRFHRTAKGMRNATWAESEATLKDFKLPEDIDPPIDLDEFRYFARKLEASRDVGTQLFCSLLRSVGVTTRLVCSLQPLPFTAASKPIVNRTSMADFVVAESDAQDTASGEESAGSSSQLPSVTPRRVKRIGQPGFANSGHVELGKPPPLQIPRRKRIIESQYPVYWVEVFNKATQKWVPFDPLVTNTVSKPSKFEPPASDAQNNMSYVLAFEEDGSAKDVTRRYVKFYNAKTRRNRVEATKDGERWWNKTMRALRRGWDLDRDQIEDTELAKKEAGERMPQNVQDFKNHPYYVLERHLRRNEVIHPKREVGKVSASKSTATSDGKVLEPIFRRRDVHVLKNGDGWYRLGREIKPGEQPLKHVRPRKKRSRFVDDDLGHLDDGGEPSVGMYAEFQTNFYVAPPVVGGRVPKNEYGNLDIYVPTMLPMGGVHLPHSDAARAARILGIDYADAVTGFEFRGRHGTAVVKGVVIAEEYREALEAIIERFQDDRAEAEEQRRTLESLRLWKRFMAGLRIRERIAGYEVEGAQDAIVEKMDEVEAEVEDDEGGGFLPDREQGVVAEPTAGRFQGNVNAHESFEGGGFLAEDPDLTTPDSDSFGTRVDDLNGVTETEPTHQILVSSNLGYELDLNADASSNPDSPVDYEGGGFMADEAEADSHGLTAARESINVDAEVQEASHIEDLSNQDSVDGITTMATLQQTTANDAPSSHDENSSSNPIKDDNCGQDARNSSSEMPEAEEPASDTDSIDQGSLLSEDPEDDDADPEWLAGS